MGRGRRLDAETRGGGAIREGDDEGLVGGAMLPLARGAAGGCMEKAGVGGAGFEARCAELSAGNEGGGRLSSSSLLSLALWCSSSVKEGMAGAFAVLAAAFGVVAGDVSWSAMSSPLWPCDSARCWVAGPRPASDSCDGVGTVGAAEPGAGAK